MLNVKKAKPSDIERIMEIYACAQEYMISSGNPTQWGHFYPARETVVNDIEIGTCHIIFDDDGIHGVFALFEGEDATYSIIDDGDWLNDEPYVTIHRIAGDGVVHGVFNCASDYCKSVSKNVRIDTHEDNKTMQHLIEKNGFEKCGIIYTYDGSPRLAYQYCEK